MALRLRLGKSDGGLVVRHARRTWTCYGEGGAPPQGGRYAEECDGEIMPGDEYLEVLWESPAYASGYRICAACAIAFYGDFVEAA